MPIDVRTEVSSSIPLAVLQRRAADGPRVIPETCGSVWNAIRTHQICGAGRHVALFRDGDAKVLIGVELEAPINDVGELRAAALPAGPVATVTHLGPYDQLPNVHRAIRDWCSTTGHRLAGPYWELYGHWQPAWDQYPNQIRTDVCYLLDSPPAAERS